MVRAIVAIAWASLLSAIAYTMDWRSSHVARARFALTVWVCALVIVIAAPFVGR